MYNCLKEIWLDYINCNGYEFGSDYISVETDDYFVICPFNKMIMIGLSDKLYIVSNGRFELTHCLCNSEDAFCFWFNILYRKGRLKAFFFRKDFNVNAVRHGITEEFTCWIDREDRNPHFTHDIRNHLINGSYENGCNENVYTMKMAKGREKDFCEVSRATDLVIDELFSLYETYKIELEETLKYTFEGFEIRIV